MRLGLLLGLAPAAALGVGRFAYALVLPAMQAALGLGFARAGLLGSANTAGYLLGALVSHRVLQLTGYRLGVYAALLLQTLSLALLAANPGFAGLMALRFAQGVLGAFVFVGGAALVLAAGGRSLAVGMYFGGVGAGIFLSPWLIPLAAGWREGWLLLAGVSLALSLLALLALPGLVEPQPPVPRGAAGLGGIARLLVSYGLYGAGYIGYMTFVTTGLPVSLTGFWAVLGAGAMLTGLAWGPLVERLGGSVALRYILAVLTLASLHPLMSAAPYLSGFLFGITFLGVITAITQVFRELLPAGAWARAMALSTAAFALGQALGPTLSGLAGDLLGGPRAALGAASLLLLAALAVAWPPQPRGARQRAR